MLKKISKLPINELEIQAREIFLKMYSDAKFPDDMAPNSLKWYISKYFQNNPAINPDMLYALNNVVQKLEHVQIAQHQLMEAWKKKKSSLEQCFNFRLFEQDCEVMYNRILTDRNLFHMSYVEIGKNHKVAKHLQEEHQKITMEAMNVCVNVKRLLNRASYLIETNNYASQSIKKMVNNLDRVWKEFATGLDERATVLSLSVAFHHKAEQYRESVTSWAAACEASQFPLLSEIQSLENAIRTHQAVYEAMCQAYTEVHSTSKKLLYQLDHLVQVCNQHSPIDARQSNYEETNPAKDYSEGASHVLNVIHQILSHHRLLERKWHAGKVKLHQRLALKLFQEDVKQVLDWLENHGEVFLRKNTGIGRNLQKAKIYQKSHEHFEKVAQNTYSNAEKLLAAATELEQTGEVASDEIKYVAEELEQHIASFAARVDQRRCRLERVVALYTHEKEVAQWVERCRAEIQSDDSLLSQETLDGTQHLVHECQNQKDVALDLCLKTIENGGNLLQEMR